MNNISNLIVVFCSNVFFLKLFVYSSKAHLSHIIMPFHPRQLESVKNNLKLWSHYVPCEIGSKLHGIAFIFYVSSSKSNIPNLRDFESELFETSKFGSDCFRSLSIEYAGLSGKDDEYLKGSRLMFEKMIKKDINFGAVEPSHIFYMEPDCRPIRSFWLKALNNLIIEPNAAFWMKGSNFRGSFGIIRQHKLYNYLHINGNALYNLSLSDEGLSDFYFNVVKRIIELKLKDIEAYDSDIFRALLWNNAQYTSSFFHMFQFSNFIQNHWHSEYSLKEILENSPDTFFIHGGKANNIV